jgi:hypothetical protein
MNMFDIVVSCWESVHGDWYQAGRTINRDFLR